MHLLHIISPVRVGRGEKLLGGGGGESGQDGMAQHAGRRRLDLGFNHLLLRRGQT